MSRTTRWRTALRGAVGRAAAGVGYTARVGPGLAGAGFVSYGLWLAWAPLGFIALGGFLLWADRRVP